VLEYPLEETIHAELIRLKVEEEARRLPPCRRWLNAAKTSGS